MLYGIKEIPGDFTLRKDKSGKNCIRMFYNGEWSSERIIGVELSPSLYTCLHTEGEIQYLRPSGGIWGAIVNLYLQSQETQLTQEEMEYRDSFYW